VWFNNGKGEFTPGMQNLAFELPGDIAVADMNGDGAPDLLLGEPTEVVLWLNDGSGGFEPTARYGWAGAKIMAPVDWDLDGDIDLILAPDGVQRGRIWLNSGSGEFSTVIPFGPPGAGPAASSLVVGDVDGDEDVDIIVGTEGENRTYLNSLPARR